MRRPGLVVARCRACGCAAFPVVPVCGRCGSDELDEELTRGGVVEEVTEREHRTYEEKRPFVGGWDERQVVRIASVRTDAGPVVVAWSPEGAPPGSRVSLEQHSGAPVIRIAQEPLS